MPSLLVKVKKKMSIYAQRRVRNVLDGQYGSVFKGRSIDFDDLRAYNFGDDIKDIDWKATARSGQTLIRRYVAVRKHNIMIVADIGRSMSALANAKDSKRDVSIFAAGVISYIAQKHGDLVGLVAGDSQRVKRFPLKESTAHLENLLKTYHDSIKTTSPASGLIDTLTYVTRNFRERMMLVVIADAAGLDTVPDDLIKRLGVRHEQMYIIVKDASVTDSTLARLPVYDIDTPEDLFPRFIRNSKKLAAAETKAETEAYNRLQKRLDRRGVASAIIASESEVIDQIVRLLERQKRAKHR
jgi:uncharacterized protein (DUF58 family)